MKSWKQFVKQLKTELYALFLAYRDPRTPLAARLFIMLVVGYAFSPIDLIPDFIPILGLLDDLLLLPLGILIARKLIPDVVLAECRQKAIELQKQARPVNKLAAVVIILIWLSLAGLLTAKFLAFF